MKNPLLPNDQTKLEHPMHELGKTNLLSKKVLFYVFGSIVFVYLLFLFFLSAPTNFPVGIIVKIEQGDNLRSVSLKLKNAHIIRSRLLFEAFAIMYGGEKHLISSDYYLENKLSVYIVARRIVKGEHHMAPIVVTIPEGFDMVQIANTFFAKLQNFDKNKFLLETKGLEGYLFPDTYFFLITDTETEVIKSMSVNFNNKIKSILPLIVKAGKTEGEIITMASLVEREAKGDVDRGFISGILWKRISLGMPLQVDVAPETYRTKGLPKIPIGNPGLAAIKAAIYPQSSPFLYYLHDKNGVIHYAKSFAEHQMNIQKYLK